MKISTCCTSVLYEYFVAVLQNLLAFISIKYYLNDKGEQSLFYIVVKSS